MRGKKVDSQFLTDFIGDCVRDGKITPDEMVITAQKEIEFINLQIRKVEDLKVRRSKLLDVISTFEKPIKSHKEEAKILTFFQIENPHICKFICDLIKDQPCTNKNNLVNSQFSQHDINFCVKQLLEHRVIAKVGESILRGEMFGKYVKFVLQED